MMRNEPLIITLIGVDRPGIVARLSAIAADCGANWDESRMARLAGRFAGIVRLDVPSDALESLENSLAALEAEGLRLTIERGEAQTPQHRLEIDLLGHDRPGILREISAMLARHRVSIDELDTDVESASMTGEPLFHAHAFLLLPADIDVDSLRADLESIADELMVDVTLDESAGG